MNMYLRATNRAGFTLIELLVVVAIIGILASVMFGYLSDAKNKGADTSVKSNLSTVKAEGEIFFLENNNSYLPAGGSTFTIATCPAYDATGTNMMSRDSAIARAIAQATATGVGSSCYNSKDTWSVAVGLKIIANTSWCVDSSGSAKLEMTVPASAINNTTFLCN